ncbi:pirin family protein [Marinobacterium arenosum]|uniref:pirin family protein n=1 Tax=Marinobacterium arenosum TaxID=2862496 RepID=UPI001C93B7AF|nr:pirin family protein [Marinobacterium arenosum]MBY4675404.1 pirin family protein [Marinobacterium arenosum]
MSIVRLQSQPSSDGAGVRIQRVHGFQDNALDPFLMLDEIHSDDPNDYLAGFPPHPHRGMETLTYIRHGGFEHEDHMGNRGAIQGGGAQWMSAGRGVIHSEMPLQQDGLLHGFQLWINLPDADKMKPAQWQDYQADQLPWQPLADSSEIKLIAGAFELQGQHLTGPIDQLPARASVADLRLAAGGSLTVSALSGQRLLGYLYEGELTVDGQRFVRRQMLKADDLASLQLSSDSGAGILLLKGEPINEPVAHYGPFVMNTEAELRQAIEDYQRGVLTD